MITIRSTADITNDGIKCLIYGQSGVGKTPLLATAPLPIIASAERGLLSIRRCNPPIPFVEITSYQSLVEFFNWCSGSHEARQFFTIGLDSLSEIAEVCLVEAKRTAGKDPRRAYGAIIDDVIALVKGFRDLPGRTVVLLAKEEYDKEEASGAFMYQPMLPGKQLGPKLPYYFDEVFRMEFNPADRKQRALHTAGSFQHVARDRSGMLAEYESPNLTNIFKKILGYQ